MWTIAAAEAVGEYAPVSPRHRFDMEYWSLEQAKLGYFLYFLFVGAFIRGKFEDFLVF